MHFLPFRCLIIAAVAVSSSLTGSATPEMTKVVTPEALPSGAQVVGLEVQPAKVVLAGRYEGAQVVVTAKLADGSTADVTRLAGYRLSGDCVEVSKSGRVAVRTNGAGSVAIEVAGQKVVVPVEVAGVVENQPVDFIRDVNPVMTRLGCNAGTCHGAKDGKFGFKLSLRGYDPLFDVRSLKDDLAGRRLNVASPDDSLMLLKSTAGVPHEGGQRTKLGEKYYDIMRAWIADGAKLDLAAPRVVKIEVSPRDPVVQQIGARQQVRVVATFSDGKTRDVTAEAFIDSGNGDVAKVEGGLVETLRRGEAPLLARYEGNYAATTLTVMGDRNGFVWQTPETWGRIDELVAAKWQRMKIAPSVLSSDEEFLRRVSLDLAGLPPTADEVRAFLADPRPVRDKRDAVIEKLLASPEFIDHSTNKWADLLQVNSKFLGKEGAKLFRDWIRKEMEANTPYDQFVRKILTAAGSNKENPAASYWKILREPAEAMENTTHLFLATRFNCNKCHDHPFERWTQDQYYHTSAYFSQVALAADPAGGNAKIGGTDVEKPRPLYEIVSDKADGEVTHLRTNKIAAPEFPFPAQAEAKGTRREQLALWMTSSDNRYFAASYVNRLWGYLTGAGIIEPLDDIRAGNPPTNPELLDFLTKEFIAHHFDVKHVLRLICQSRTYQLGIGTNQWNADDKTNYSHALARRLPAEVLYDSVLKVVGSGPRLPGGLRAGQLPDSATDLPSGFLANLGRPARESSCECERRNDLGLGSVMALLGGPAVSEAIGDAANELAKLTTAQPDDRKLIDELFLRVLSRPASEQEISKVLANWQQLDGDNAALVAQLEPVLPIIAKAEADRAAMIAKAKDELARYEAEVGPKLAEAEAKRVAAVTAAEAAVKEYETQHLAAAQTVFENTAPVVRTLTGWVPLDIVEARASGGITLKKQPDGSYLASGARPPTTDYVVKADTKLAGITGFAIEVLPSGDEKNFGPGRAPDDGNFVLGEVELKVSAGGTDATPLPVKFASAVADFSQEDFAIAQAIDGIRDNENNGWAISASYGVPHFAALTLEKPLGDAEKGVRLRFELNQPRKSGFAIARFRLWATTGTAPVQVGYPQPVSDALRKIPATRTDADKAALAAYWNANDPELAKRRFHLAQAPRPLPPDPGLVQRRAAASADVPLALDPKLARLRQDAEQSKAQLANRRLTSVQDLAWALINTPSFLFNH
ncbi:MAG: DUF1549 domain-containing protein [Chthoniobacter sp.]|nr:DUF1549 domain-containing protein [Chthoniobacter sp.]